MNIKQDGSKRFNLLVKTGTEKGQRNGRQSQPRQGDQQGGRSDGSKNNRKGSERPQRNQSSNTGDKPNKRGNTNSIDDARENIITLLEEKLEETRYCRHGYIELYFTSSFGESEFRGECQESASPEDRREW